jgi:DNA-binding NarL/FixJ family response regulator
MNATVVIVVIDLLFQSRIRAAAEALGLDVRVADTPAGTDAAIAAAATLVVIDVDAAGIDTPSAIRAAKAAGAKVLAFGRHTEPLSLRSARDAGADVVVARSQLAEELPELLAGLAGLNRRDTAAQRFELRAGVRQRRNSPHNTR